MSWLLDWRFILFFLVLLAPAVFMALMMDGVIKLPPWLDLTRFPFGQRFPSCNALVFGLLLGAAIWLFAYVIYRLPGA